MKLHEALFSKTRCAVLALFLLNPRRRFFVREVVARLGSGHGTVQKELERLAQVGVLSSCREGMHRFYQANTDCTVYEDLKRVLDHTVGPVGRLREALGPLRGDITVAFIYGSVAGDAALDDSDIDLMVVGSTTLDALVRVVRPVEDALGREVNPSVYPAAEFKERLAGGNPFLQNVMDGPRKMIIGELDEFVGLV